VRVSYKWVGGEQGGGLLASMCLSMCLCASVCDIRIRTCKSRVICCCWQNERRSEKFVGSAGNLGCLHGGQ